MTTHRTIKILGTGKYLPENVVTAKDLDQRLGLEAGWTAKKAGVHVRHYVSGETAAQMGAMAAQGAMLAAGLGLQDIDCIISASGASQQPIPCNAALIQKELGGEHSGIPCYDVNSTCLSFVTALDVVSYMVDHGRYNKVLIVSSEIASVALDWDDPHSCTLFGDGAAAVVIGRTPKGETSRIYSAAMKTHSAGVSYAEVKGGGSRLHASEYRAENKSDYLFRMDGPRIYKLAAKLLPGMTQELLDEAGLTMDKLDLVIPHQASLLAMKLVQKNLGVGDERFMYIIGDHGNTIAASIPMALHEAIGQGRLKRGDHFMLLGTSAGLSVGGMILEY